jgi:small GTP-binding protein
VYDDEMIIKLVAIGSYGVGKTTLIRGYAEGKFDPRYLPTLGVDITIKRIVVDNQRIKLIMMVTTGQELFGSNLRSTYFEGSSGCIAVYDITRRDTFEALDRWITEYRNVVGESTFITIVGNKNDLEKDRAVTTNEGRNYARENGYMFYECSGKLGGAQIPKIFLELVRKYLADLKNLNKAGG